MRNTKSNATLPATSNTTYMTKLYPQELSTYLENEYDKCPHIRKSSKPHGFVYLMICNTNKCKIGITKDLYQRWQQVNQQLVSSKTKVIYLYASPLCMNKLKIEKSFKEHFKNYNINGSESKCEWFDKSHVDSYLQYLNDTNFNFNFPTIEQIEKEKENVNKFANMIWFGKNETKIKNINNDINQASSLLNEYTDTINTFSEQINEVHKIFEYILPKEYIDSIDYICEYNEISKEELLRKSLIFYMQYFNENISILPDKIKNFKRKTLFDTEVKIKEV